MPSSAETQARRERYIELRSEGMNNWEAMTEVGLDPTISRYRRSYEELWQAVERGETPLVATGRRAAQ